MLHTELHLALLLMPKNIYKYQAALDNGKKVDLLFQIHVVSMHIVKMFFFSFFFDKKPLYITNSRYINVNTHDQQVWLVFIQSRSESNVNY
jgi:hypothetical protein